MPIRIKLRGLVLGLSHLDVGSPHETPLYDEDQFVDPGVKIERLVDHIGELANCLHARDADQLRRMPVQDFRATPADRPLFVVSACRTRPGSLDSKWGRPSLTQDDAVLVGAIPRRDTCLAEV